MIKDKKRERVFVIKSMKGEIKGVEVTSLGLSLLRQAQCKLGGKTIVHFEYSMNHFKI